MLQGRSGKNCTLDVVLGENTAISRQHAAIRYNFESKCFELIVMGKNGVSVESAATGALVMYTPQSPPQPLRSKDLIIVADKRFYFLLPRSLGGHRSKRRKIEQKGQGQPAAPQGSAPPQAPPQPAAAPTAPQDPAQAPAPAPVGELVGPTATPAEVPQQEGMAPPVQEQQQEPEPGPQQLLPPPSPPPAAPDDDPLVDANALPYVNGLVGGEEVPGMI